MTQRFQLINAIAMYYTNYKSPHVDSSSNLTYFFSSGFKFANLKGFHEYISSSWPRRSWKVSKLKVPRTSCYPFQKLNKSRVIMFSGLSNSRWNKTSTKSLKLTVNCLIINDIMKSKLSNVKWTETLQFGDDK